MTIDQKITEISDYLKAKILQNDFKFIECSDITAKLHIDDTEVLLWIYSKKGSDLAFFEPMLQKKDVRGFLSVEEKQAGWQIIKPYIIKHFKKQLADRKSREFMELEKVIAELEK